MYENFDNLRKAKGWSVYQVATMTGISPSAFSMWKNGKTKELSADNMRRLADLFGVSVGTILDGRASEHPAEFQEVVTLASGMSEAQLKALATYARFLASEAKR